MLFDQWDHHHVSQLGMSPSSLPAFRVCTHMPLCFGASVPSGLVKSLLRVSPAHSRLMQWHKCPLSTMKDCPTLAC